MKKMYFNFLTIICLLFSLVSNAQTNYALNLAKSSSQYVSVPHSSSINLGATFTIEAWIYPVSSDWLTIVDKGDYNFDFAKTDDGRLGFYNRFSGGWWNYSSSTVPLNTWTHVAITLSGGVLTFYMNGTANGAANVNYAQDNGVLNIGRQSPSTCLCNTFDGQMDELRLWNVARTATEINDNKNVNINANTSGLAAYYKFNEGTGTTAADATANANDGTLVNGASWATSSVSLTNSCTNTTSTATTTACDSLVWNGTTYTASGVYTYSTTNAAGCDSTAILNLTVNHSSTSSTTTTVCDSLVWNGTTYTSSGVYTYSTTNAAGCDSTATLNLTVNHSSTSNTTTSACDSLVWNGTTYTSSGVYTYSTTNAAGCDSTATLNLTINHSSTSNTTTSACDSLVWNGTTYTASGVYTYSTTNAVGCDSTATLNLTVNHSSTSSTTTTVCDSLIWNGSTYKNSGTYTAHFTNAVGCDSTATLVLTVNYKPAVDSIVGLTNIEILAIGGGGGAGGPDGAVGAGGGAGGAVYGKYTLPANGSNIYTVGVGGAGGYGQGCAGNAAGGTAGTNGGGTGGNAGTGGCSGGGGGGGGWSGFYQGSTYYVVAGGGAGGGGSNEGTANDVATPGGGNQAVANGTSMTGQNGTAYSGDGGGGGAGGGGYYGGAGQTNLTTNGVGNGGANYANPTNRNVYATYVGASGAANSGGGVGGQGTTTTITNSSNFNYTNTYGKGGNAQGNGGTSTTANGNNGVVIIRYQGSPVATGGTITQSGGYTLHTFTTIGSNTFRANSATAVCVGSTTSLSCATPNGVWSSSDTTIATINPSTGMVTGIAAGVVTITYTVTDVNGCVGYSTKQFTVNPLPVVPAITGNTTLCDNTTSLLSNTLTSGVWTSSNTAKATVNSSTGLVTGVAAGNSTITYLYTDNNGCSNTNSTVVTVNASPTVAAISGNNGVCIGSTTTYTNATTGGVWSSSNTNVATIDSAGLITSVATGSATISYTVTNTDNCVKVVTKTITVNALPNVTANATATTVCYGTSVTLTGGNASSYTWNNGVTNGVAFNATATTTYTVTGTDGNGCVKTANITITVNPLPVVSISPSITTVCNGYPSTLTASGASTYSWTGFGTSPVIDQISVTPRLAVGLHKLKSSYSGAAIRIRRSSDNAEQDFGFSGNDLDVAAINTFVGAGTGYVKTLYDQSGNGNNLSQTTNSLQPLFIASGLNGKPVIRIQYSVGQTLYNTTNFGQPFTVVYAAKQTGSNRGRMVTSYSGNWLLGWWGGNKNCAYFEGWVNNGPTASGDNNPYVYTGAGTSGSYQLYQNGSLIANNGGGSSGPNGISMGASGCCYGERSDGDFTDLYVFNSVLNTTNRQLVENNTGAYYGISGVASVLGATQTAYPSSTTTYTVYGTDANSCVGTATQTITVNPKPNAGNDITNACGGSTQTLTGTANTGTWTALSTNPSGSTLSSTTSGVATVSFVNAATGTYSYIYTLPTTDCSDTMNIVVGAKPDAGADVSNICGGNIISLTGAPNTGTWSAMGSNPTTATSLSSVGASLLARYDASVTSSFTQSSGVVTAWNDLSGNGYNLTQSSTGPTLTTINGVQAFDFNSAKRMTRTSVPLAQNVTVLMAVKYNSAIATWGNFMCHGDHDADWSMRHNNDGSNSVGFHTNNDNSTVLAPLTNGNTYILVGRLTQNGNGTNNVEYWAYDLNGSLVTRNATFSTTISAGSKTVFVGSSDIGGEASNAKIGEILYYNSSLSSNDLTNAVNYLKDKWFNGATGGGFTQSSGIATVTYPNAATGTYNYVYTSTFGCTDTASVFVTPKPNAGADINYLCGGATQVLNGTTTNGTWSALSTNPTGASLGSTTSGSASVTFTNLASGTYNFIYTLPTNCSDTMSITVRPKPNAGTDDAVCILNVATGVTLTSNVTGVWSAMNGNAGTSNIVSASSASTQVNNFSVVGDYNFINTNNGCTDTVKVTVTPAGSISNYVWKDQNNDGLQNEPTSNGVNGITVELYKKDGNGDFNYYATTTTADNGSGNPGYYNFGICEDGVYKIKVPTVNPFTQTHLTAQDGTANTDGNSDVNPADGFSPEITIDTHGSGLTKDNNTVDAGYQICTKPIAGSDFTSCGGQLVAITGVSTTPALPTTDGNWSALGSNPSGATLGATVLGVATVQFDSLASGVYSFIYTVTGGCDDTLNITVGAKPAAGSDLYEVCGGSIIPLTGLPSGGTWSQASANASGATVGSTSNGVANISFANLVSGTYTLIYTTPFGCTDTMTISTKPKPNAGSDVYMECGTPRLFDTIRATPFGGSWSALSSNNNLVTLGTTDTAGKARINLPVAPNQGSWTFIYTAPNGCTDTMTYVIGVTGTPAPTINSGSNPICGNGTVQICPTQWGWSNYQWYKDGVAVGGIAGTQACITIDTSKVGSYTLAGTNGSACWSKQSPAVVVSLAGPVTPTVTSQSGSFTACNNGSITLISSSNQNNQWNKDGNAISGATGQYYNATTNGVYTVTTNNCGYVRTSGGVTVTIVPQINVASIQSNTGTVCTGSSITLTNATAGGVWSSSNTAKATVNASGVVTGVGVGSATITYTVTINGCSNAASYTLNVADGSNIAAPSVAAQGSTGLCGNSTVQICPTVWGWNNYQWYKNGVAVTQNGTGACITVDTSKLGSYTLTATNSNGCWSPASNAVVIATASTPATPTIAVNGAASTCNGQPITMTSSSSTGNQWKKDGVAISGATGQTYQTSATGVYTVTVTDNCGGTATSAGTSLSISPYITVNSIQSVTGSICKNATSTLINTTPGGVWSSSNTSVATINASGVVTGVDTGTVTITYTVTIGGCSNSVSATFTVVDGSNVAVPVIIAQSSAALCANGNVTLCPTNFGWSGYQWYKNGVAVLQNGYGACITVDTSALGTYTLAGAGGTGCWSSQSNSITVSTMTSPSTPTVTANGSTSTCNGGTVVLTSSSSTGNQWNKDGNPISGATSQSYTASASGVYTVTVTNCAGTATSAGTTLTITPYITVNSIQSVTGNICKNATSTLTNTTPGGVWSSNNTSIATVSSGGVVTGVDTGTVTITYTVTSGACSNAVSATFRIVDGSSIVPPTIVAQSSTLICSNSTVQLCPTTFGWSNYQWYKNGVAVSANGTGACITVDTSKLGSYTLAGTTGTGCWSSQSNAIAVSVASAPTAATITAGGSTNICNGNSVTLTSSISSNNQWYKDGSIIGGATSQTYAASAIGVYQVAQTSSCGNTLSAGITVTVAAPIQVASISSNSSSTVCFGNSLTLSCTTAGGVWSSNNTSVATVNASGVVSTVAAGTAIISYTVTSGACSASSTYTITVQSGSVTTPVLDIRGSVNICGSGSLQMCPQNWGYSNYQWYKNGVPYSTSACITVNTAGAYTLAGTNGNGCWSAQSSPANVTLNSIPAVVATTGPTSVCVGSSITLSNSSNIPNGGAGIWTSTAGRATISSLGVVTGTSAGIATLVYTITSSVGCSASASYNVTVNALPSVPSISFAAGTTGITGSGGYCRNKTFTLLGNPVGGSWSATGAFSITNAGVVTTAGTAGAASVSYTITDVNGCSNSRTANVNVTASCKGINANQQTAVEPVVLYPNPAHTIVNLRVKALIGTGTIIITDLYGKQLKQQPLSMGVNTIDVSSFAKGMYLVSVITESGKQTQKVVVE